MEVGLALDREAGSDSVNEMASIVLRHILDGVDGQSREAGSPLRGTRESAGAQAEEETVVGASEMSAISPADGRGSAETRLPICSLLLPHEGERWGRVRGQVARLPIFADYMARARKEDPPWSVDEVFASFCLDRIEETFLPTLAKPTKVTTTKASTTSASTTKASTTKASTTDASTTNASTTKAATTKTATRRKGQPKKYERKRRSRESPGRSVGTAEGEDPGDKSADDDLAMDDNPNDLDYQPVPIVPYPKRRRSLPRTANNAKPSPKPAPSPKRAPRVTAQAQPPGEKPVAPKRGTRSPKKAAARETLGPPRKRGRPRKLVTEDQKKAPKARVKSKKPAKQYVRVEVRLQRLPKMYECKTCREHFPEPEEVRRHFLGAHQPEASPPTQDDGGGGAPGSLTTHPGAEESPAALLPDITHLANLLRQCPKCKKFVGDVTAHRREHRERNFICEECGKGFTENQILQKHRRVHEMDRTGQRYACTLCDKSYRFAQNLRSHAARHSGRKTFICHQCGKSFYTNNRLIIHAAVHLAEKPFKCGECGRGFSQKSNMQKHQRVHTGVRPYCCDLCTESFNHKVSLKNHRKKRHGIDWWKEEAGRAGGPASPKPPAAEASPAGGNQGTETAGAIPAAFPPEKAQPVPASQWKGGEMPLQAEPDVAHWREGGPPGESNSQQPNPVDMETLPLAASSSSSWPRPDGGCTVAVDPAAPSQSGDGTVQLQTLQPAGAQWKATGAPAMDRQGQQQAGDQGMAAFLYQPTYLQGYPSGYSGMPVIPINTESTILPTTRPY